MARARIRAATDAIRAAPTPRKSELPVAVPRDEEDNPVPAPPPPNKEGETAPARMAAKGAATRIASEPHKNTLIPHRRMSIIPVPGLSKDVGFEAFERGRPAGGHLLPVHLPEFDLGQVGPGLVRLHGLD